MFSGKNEQFLPDHDQNFDVKAVKKSMIVWIELVIFVSWTWATEFSNFCVMFHLIGFFAKIVKKYSKYNYGELRCISSRYN